MQRVVFHFAEALQERIDKESGRVSMKELKRYDDISLRMSTNLTFVTS